MVTRARRGAGVFRTIFYLRRSRPRSHDARVRLPAQPRHRARQHGARQIGIEGPLWFNSPEWSKPSLTLLALWSVGNTMIIFLAAILDVRATCTSPPSSTARAPSSGCAGDAPDDQPRDPLRGRVRRDPRAAVFTQAYVAASIAAGRRRRRAPRHAGQVPRRLDALLPHPPLLQGFRFFHMATRPRWQWSCSAYVRCHALIIRNCGVGCTTREQFGDHSRRDDDRATELPRAVAVSAS